jgi:hypothetical protein
MLAAAFFFWYAKMIACEGNDSAATHQDLHDNVGASLQPGFDACISGIL